MDDDRDGFSEVFAPGAFQDLPKDMPVKDQQGNYIRGVKAHVDHDEDGHLIVDIRYPDG